MSFITVAVERTHEPADFENDTCGLLTAQRKFSAVLRVIGWWQPRHIGDESSQLCFTGAEPKQKFLYSALWLLESEKVASVSLCLPVPVPAVQLNPVYFVHLSSVPKPSSSDYDLKSFLMPCWKLPLGLAIWFGLYCLQSKWQTAALLFGWCFYDCAWQVVLLAVGNVSHRAHFR